MLTDNYRNFPKSNLKTNLLKLRNTQVQHHLIFQFVNVALSLQLQQTTRALYLLLTIKKHAENVGERSEPDKNTFSFIS